MKLPTRRHQLLPSPSRAGLASRARSTRPQPSPRTSSRSLRSRPSFVVCCAHTHGRARSAKSAAQVPSCRACAERMPAHSERHHSSHARRGALQAMGQACLVLFAFLHVSSVLMIAITSVMKVSRPKKFVTRCGVRPGAVVQVYTTRPRTSPDGAELQRVGGLCLRRVTLF